MNQVMRYSSKLFAEMHFSQRLRTFFSYHEIGSLNVKAAENTAPVQTTILLSCTQLYSLWQFYTKGHKKD